jgi:hypothetical protein
VWKSIIVLGVSLSSGTGFAGASMAGPTYIGERSANPEQETYGYLVTGVGGQLPAFLLPTQSVGVVTGDDEKDTIAHQLWLFRVKR